MASIVTKKWNYYNDNDPKVAAWAAELIKKGLVPDGEIDTRSIWDVAPSDLAGFTQCHFFCGILGWSHALRLAGWPDDKPVWTGSCPCQPFSAAGQRAGFADERHLWPAFFHLIEQCRPGVVYGEQVASALEWIDLVFDDLEGAGYACRAEDLCAAGVGAPHIRQRLYWVANANIDAGEQERPIIRGRFDRGYAESWAGLGCGGRVSGVADSGGSRLEVEREQPARQEREAAERGGAASLPGPLDGFWRDVDWLGCRDGRWRPVERSVLGMDDGLSGSLVPGGAFVPASSPLAQKQERLVMRLRGYGNAIVPQVAATFVSSLANGKCAGGMMLKGKDE